MLQLLPYVSATYAGVLRLAKPFNPRAAAMLAGRDGLMDSLNTWRNEHPGHLTWFHCASLGEFEMARPLMELIKEKKQTQVLLVTFFSPSGYDHKKNDNLPDGVFYLPLDGAKNPALFLDMVQPNLVYFVKYDFWPGYMLQLAKRKIPVILINGIFRPNQLFFKWYGGGMKKLLKTFAHIFVQYQPSADLLADMGIDQVTVSGDLRFDRVAQMAEKALDFEYIRTFCEDGFTLAGGSTWAAEEELLAETLNRISQQRKIKLLLVPHDISERHLRSLEQKFTDTRYVRLSLATPTRIKNSQVLIVDSIGKLASSYRYAHMALIGGGFTGKLHNILEALVHGVPVFFGPKTEKFPEASYFMEAGCAFSVHNAEALVGHIEELMREPQKLSAMKKISQQHTASMKGAAQKVYNEIYG